MKRAGEADNTRGVVFDGVRKAAHRPVRVANRLDLDNKSSKRGMSSLSIDTTKRALRVDDHFVKLTKSLKRTVALPVVL